MIFRLASIQSMPCLTRSLKDSGVGSYRCSDFERADYFVEFQTNGLYKLLPLRRRRMAGHHDRPVCGS